MRKGPAGTKVVGIDQAGGSVKSTGNPVQDFMQRALAMREQWEREVFDARLKQILTPAEMEQVYQAGYGTKSTLALPEALATKITTDPTIKAIMAREAELSAPAALRGDGRPNLKTFDYSSWAGIENL